MTRRNVTRISLLGLAFLLFSLAACSSNGGARATVEPQEAAQTIGSVYSLSDDQISCLQGAFDAHHDATRPLASDGTASDADLRALGSVESDCIPVEALSAAIVGGVTEGLGTLTDSQKTCLDGAVTGLADTDRTTLLVGLAVNTALDDVQLAELGKVTNGLLETCHLSDQATVTTGTTATP